MPEHSCRLRRDGLRYSHPENAGGNTEKNPSEDGLNKSVQKFSFATA
jgi:hypothetical protein